MSTLYLPLFAEGPPISSQALHTAISDASSSSGSILLSACHLAFHQELSSLSTDDLTALDIDVMDFPLPKDLLVSPMVNYERNIVISGSTIFLLQTLRYLAFVEATRTMTNSLTPFSDILKRNLESRTGILGVSSGLLPACVVATSCSILSYITKAVEAYRLALWIGIRCHLFRINALKDASLDLDTDLPWSLLFKGLGRVDVEESIAAFSKEAETSKLCITAIVDNTCITVSGRPDILCDFSTFVTVTNDGVVHKATSNSLYYSTLNTPATRDKVLSDVASRKIKFPEFSDVVVPIRSTSDGDLITNERSGSLLEAIVDMMLVRPVDWNAVVQGALKVFPQNEQLHLLNVGPGLDLARSIERAFPRDRTSIVDLASPSLLQTQPKQEPIAIIGMAVNMPGAPNVTKLWEILEQGLNTISEIPEHRFRVTDYTENATGTRRMKAHTGNFIDGADEFDNVFFKISPREAKSMDPQQRVLLHTAYEALEDSGYVPNSTPTNNPATFGCYIGVATYDYILNLRDDIDVYYITGIGKAFLSGRISYALQLGGPSIVMDTACSSSNIALYQAARSLMNRDCDAALVGGVNIITSPDTFLGLDRGHFLSPTGQCKAFDASADGYSRAEGCGVFVLKRLSDAVAENDRILGVIRGIEVNQSGNAHSITHPHASTQASLYRCLLGASNVDPSQVNVIEAHGTGTQAGDPNELESIRSVFSTQRSADNPLHVTSIKANIGHLEAASGSAGLAKLLLMFQHRTIPPQISLKTLNPLISPLHVDHTVIDTVSVPWVPAVGGPTRLAMLNNFGASGSNSAVLLEEYRDRRPDVALHSQGMHLVFGLSAKDNLALERLRSKYLEFLEGCENHSLADIAYSMTARRQIYDHRLATSANNLEDLREKLRRARPIHTNPKELCIAFVFSGQGAQYLGMGRSLYQSSQLFHSHIDKCHAILIKGGFPGVLAIIANDSDESGLGRFEEIEAYHASIFALQYALAQLWIFWGISPSAVAGHSLGEYAALTVAGVISLQDALLTVANRARLMVQKCAINETGMIAVNLGPAAVYDVLRALPNFSSVTVACFNSSIDCVLSGPLTTLMALKEYLDAEIRCKNTLLPVPFGYHSQAMSPLTEDLNLLTRRVTLRPPNIPIVSNVFGNVVFPGDDSSFTPGYFSRHCIEAVQFDKGIQALFNHSSSPPINAWIEIGPHTTTFPLLKANTNFPSDSILLASLRRQQDDWQVLTGSLAQLYLSRTKICWRHSFSHLKEVSYVGLPSYPFSPNKFWVEYREPRTNADSDPNPTPPALSSITDYSMLDRCEQRPSTDRGSPSPSVHSRIVSIVAEACDIHSRAIDLNADLASLGVDSLMTIEIFAALHRAFPDAHLNSQTLSICTNLLDIIREVSDKMNASGATGNEAAIILTNMSGASTPKTLVPDDSQPQLMQNMDINVKRILSSVLGLPIHDIADDADFDDLGLDSLGSIEALHAFKSCFDLELSNRLFMSLRTPRALQTYLFSQLLKSSNVSSEKPERNLSNMRLTNTEAISVILRFDENPLVVQSSDSGLHPLFLIHDGGGLVNYYERLPSLGRSTWAIHNPNFSTSHPWDSVEEMAKVYSHYIANTTFGPLLVGGWSFGGVAAYEVARQLELMGRSPQGILLIDAPNPNPTAQTPLSSDAGAALIDSVLNLEGRSTNSEVGRLMKAQFSLNTQLLRTYKPQRFLHDCPPMIMLRCREGYNPPGVQVPAWLSDRSRPEAAIAQWKTLTKSPIKILDIPGHHFQPFHRGNIEMVSNRIAEACLHLEHM
ncbi:Type I Iterative PKS [Tricholoma furcatifolium]|nr:Type I Iterative PKS [Tricholoma furcatifolium]